MPDARSSSTFFRGGLLAEHMVVRGPATAPETKPAEEVTRLMRSEMSDSLDEIMARHDAATACGCNCCDNDYCAYVERQKRQALRDAGQAGETLPGSAASQRKSLRYQFEHQQALRP